METHPLTKREWRVLLELVGRQRDSDKTAAEKLGMAPSNFAVIKKRLAEKRILLEEVRVNPHVIAESRVASFIWIDYNQPVRESLKDEFEITRPSFPIAATYAAPDWSMNLDYFKSFEDAENARLRLAEILRNKARQYVSDYAWKMLPLSHLVTCHMKRRFIEYCMTGKAQPVDPARIGSECDCEYPPSEPPPRLNATEKKALIALRKYPQMKKSEIAEKIGVQQSSLSEVFKSLRRKGVINYVRTLDPSRIPGREVATFALIDLKQPLLGNEVQKAVAEMLNRTPQLTRISYTRTFILSIGFFSSLDSAEEAHLTMLKALGDNIKAFSFKIVPCSHLKTIYSPYFLEQMFGISL
jgi:DNA-binding MarR family transcriptional regulator